MWHHEIGLTTTHLHLLQAQTTTQLPRRVQRLKINEQNAYTPRKMTSRVSRERRSLIQWTFISCDYIPRTVRWDCIIATIITGNKTTVFPSVRFYFQGWLFLSQTSLVHCLCVTITLPRTFSILSHDHVVFRNVYLLAEGIFVK